MPKLQPPLQATGSSGSTAASKRLNDRVDQMVKMLLAERFERAAAAERRGRCRRCCTQAADDVAAFVEQRQQKLHRGRRPTTWATIDVEADKIRDSVVQLLLNAIKFTPDGGTIRLSAQRTRDGGVAHRASPTPAWASTPASLPRIFEPFFTRFDVSRHSLGHVRVRPPRPGPGPERRQGVRRDARRRRSRSRAATSTGQRVRDFITRGLSFDRYLVPRRGRANAKRRFNFIHQQHPIHELLALRQRLQEPPAIPLGQHARVEDDHDARVGLRADQPAEALLQLDDRLRHLVVEERLAAARLRSPPAAPRRAAGPAPRTAAW